MPSRLILSLVAAAALAGAAPPPPRTNDQVRKIVAQVSADRIEAILQKLESFETRNTFSATHEPGRGIGAARQWIHDELRSYSPRLQVRYDSYHVKKKGRVFRNVEIVNVVALLPGTVHPDRYFVVSGHYDSLNLRKQDADASTPRYLARETDNDKIAAAYAPGVVDDGSGTAAVIELARVFSQYEFENSILFVAFAAEEQGLVGSSLFAARAKEDGLKIEGVLNNDIIGSVEQPDSGRDDTRIRVFSESPEDSMSRQIARYVRDVGGRYVDEITVDTIFRADRFGRGGDHTSFNQKGYPAVRFTTPMENYDHQHSPTDLFAHASAAYTAKVARVNAAALASLALAPVRPVNVSGAASPLIQRGASGYDAVLMWDCEFPEDDLAGYAVVLRKTTAPYWEREIFVGLEGEHRLADVSIDEWVFGVKAIDRDGNESLVSPYVQPARRPVEWELY